MGYLGPSPSDEALKIGDDVILSSHINDGVIVNADINASAAIAMSKTTLVGGAGLTLSTNTLSVDADQSGQITSVGTLTGLTVAAHTLINPSASTSSYLQFATGGTTYGYVGSESSIVSGGTAADMTIGASGDTNLTLTTNGAVRATLNSSGATFAGNITIPAGNAIYLDGGGNSKVEEFATDKVNIQAGGENLVLLGNGSSAFVGVGTTTPSQAITIKHPEPTILFIHEHSSDEEIGFIGDCANFLTGSSPSATSFGVRSTGDFRIGTGGNNLRMTIDSSGDTTFTGQIINTGDCSFRNGEILMANDRFDVLGGQDRRITLGTIGTPGQNSSHNVRGRSDGLFLNAPSKIVGEIDGSAKWEMTSSSTSFNNQLNINDDAFTFGDDKAKVYNFTFENDSGFTSATEYMRIENSTGNWVWCVVEVTVISGFGSSSHYGKQKREYFVRILGDNNNGNGVTVTTATIGTDSGASEGVITLTTVGNEVTDSLLFKVQTAGGRRTSVFTKVYASNNQYLTITGQ